MLETILHQQEIQQLLNEKKLQTQEVQSNTVQALKVDSIVMENTCSGKENSNSETASSKSVKESSLDSATKDVHTIKYKMSKAKGRCMTYFQSLHSHFQVLSKEDLKGTRIEHGFKWAFMSLFGQDQDTFTFTMLLNVDRLQKQLDKDEFQEDGSMAAFWHMSNVKKYVAERTHYKKQYDRRVNKRQIQTQESKVDAGKAFDAGKALDADLFVTKSIRTNSTVQDKSSKSGNDTYADNADIRPIYDEEPMAKVELSRKGFCNCCFKNDLRKLKGNSVDTKFAKPSVLGKLILQSLRKQSITRQPNAFKSKRPHMSKPQFASQVDVNNNLSRPVTQHYLPKRRESVFVKPDHMIASSESRNSSKNMPRFSSNDMVYNHYLDEARKKTQERDRNSKTSVMPSARFQSTTDGSKPKPRSTNHSTRSLPISKSSCVTITVVPKADHSKNSSSFSDSKHFVCSTCQKYVFNANHDACTTKILKEVNSHKTRNSNKLVVQKSHTQKPVRQISTGHNLILDGNPRVEFSKLLVLGTSLTGQQKQRIDFSAGSSFNVK
ncbi:hypothetical protein Tco_0454163 [Tanacetum coccineum]